MTSAVHLIHLHDLPGAQSSHYLVEASPMGLQEPEGVVGGLPPPTSSRQAAPVTSQLASSLLPRLPSVLIFRPWGHHTAPSVAGAASNKLHQDEFTIFGYGVPEEKRRDGKLPEGGLQSLQQELLPPSPFPNWSSSGLKQSRTGQVLRSSACCSMSDSGSLLSQMCSQHRESAGHRIRVMESCNRLELGFPPSAPVRDCRAPSPPLV